MDKKDRISVEIKSIFDEETKELTLSDQFLDNLRKKTRPTLKDKVHSFLNKELEIPLAPAFVGLAALIAISIIPKDILKNEQVRIIDIGGSQVIVREQKEVSSK